jgi:cytochrome c oxidase subunit 1/cytochrome c oxidase subunit I+III
MRRRVWTYLPEDGLFGLNLITTIGAAVLAVGLFVSLANVLRSLKHGRPGGENPWNADTLEWSTKSPPASYAFAHVPTVASLHPLWDEHDETSDPRGERTLAHGRQTLTTSAIDARPVGIGQMPEDTIVPLVLALAVAAVFTGLLLRQVVPAAIALILSGACIAAWLRPRPEKKA